MTGVHGCRERQWFIREPGLCPEDRDVGIRFILTAVGQVSGLAQTTFTDDNKITSVLRRGEFDRSLPLIAGGLPGAVAQAVKGTTRLATRPHYQSAPHRQAQLSTRICVRRTCDN
jgi:hypothetical protein